MERERLLEVVNSYRLEHKMNWTWKTSAPAPRPCCSSFQLMCYSFPLSRVLPLPVASIAAEGQACDSNRMKNRKAAALGRQGSITSPVPVFHRCHGSRIWKTSLSASSSLPVPPLNHSRERICGRISFTASSNYY